MDKRTINQFLKKYADNNYSDQEHQLFINWLNSASTDEIQEIIERYNTLTDIYAENEIVLYPRVLQEIESKLNGIDKETIQENHSVRLWPRYRKIASAAALLLMATAFAFYFSTDFDRKKSFKVVESTKSIQNEISPGGNKATLTLADGKIIDLSNAKNGFLAEQFGIRARKPKEGQIVFDLSTGQNFPENFQTKSYNTIRTPRGGQFQVVLPDGSKVWLNASSSIRFPASFVDEERIVELDGEAYFEVVKLGSSSADNGKKIPFKVKSGGHLVEVLGTHFNVKAYSDEVDITTTLLEGSVKVSENITQKSRVLIPGQQARVGSSMKVSDVDVRGSTGWKEGQFNFSGENIESIMRSISRWYDVDVSYKKNITRETFVGSVSRFENVSEVLKMLELTGAVHFKVEGRRIIVMP
ncbi:MAG: FecR domain-containing protein [Daejeonella sp.]|uniref:FecR family protein n=1 Tax=Daejeonella sp. TaxID=2805397 RepID=UPI003C71FBC6